MSELAVAERRSCEWANRSIYHSYLPTTLHTVFYVSEFAYMKDSKIQSSGQTHCNKIF